MQNWNDLIYCLALAEYKTMGKAAKVLRTNATTVSRHINSLSETYQQPIFIKDGQEWRPTKFGLRLVEIAQNIKADVDKVQANAAVHLEGNLRVHCELRQMQSFLFQNWRSLLRKEPNLNLHLTYTPASLAYGEVDISFTCEAPTEGRLVRKKVTTTEYAVFASEKHLQQLEGWVEFIDQAGHSIDQSFLQATFDEPPRMTLPGLNLSMQAIQELPYIAMLPRSLAAHHGDLCEVPNSPVIVDTVWASFHESRRNDPLIRSVFNWLETID